MSLSVDQLYREALSLPLDSRESLVEKLVQSIETNVDPDVEHAHVQEAIRRRDEVRNGIVQSVPGDEALKQVRSAIEKRAFVSTPAPSKNTGTRRCTTPISPARSALPS